MQRYFAIRSDRRCSQSIESAPLIDYLDGLDVLRSSGPGQFSNNSSFPRCQIVLVGATPPRRNAAPVTVNLIELICGTEDFREMDERYEQLGIEVARHLGWELVLQPDDRQVWP